MRADAKVITGVRYESALGRHKDGESGEWEQWILCDLSELLEDEVAEQTTPMSFSILRWRGMGGGAAKKKQRNMGAGCGARNVSGARTEAHSSAIGAYELVRSHHALRACEVGSRKG